MSQSSSPSPDHAHARIGITNPRDFYGGLVLIALALFSFYAGWDLPGMQGFAFGPGTAPRLFGGMLLGVGVIVTALGFLTIGPPLERYSFRGIFFVAASILVFAYGIRPLGLFLASFLTFMVSALASKETRWVEATIMAVLLTAFCVGLFVYLLNLPFQLWPEF
jgi:putative tricarboxylic transport membrane protein